MTNFINIDKSDYINAINLYLGLYNPLKGFVCYEDHLSILEKKKIQKINFTIPINIFCSRKQYNKFAIGEKIYLKFKNEIIGFLILQSKFFVKKNFYLSSVFGTSNKTHVGVYKFSKKIDQNPYALGGEVVVHPTKVKKFFKNSNFQLLKKLKKIKNKVSAFSTRNIPHIGHNLIQKQIIKNKKKITIFLILSIKNKYSSNTLIKSYVSLKKSKIFKNINILPIYLPTFFAGPNEAFFQAKIFENLGYNFFYVGRDHAGFKSFYGKFESQKIFNKLKSKIKIIKFNEPMFCDNCNTPVINKFKNKKSCPICKSKFLSELNGTDIKSLIKLKNRDLLSKFLDKNVYDFFEKKKFSLQSD